MLVFLGAVHILAFVAVFVSIAREVDFVILIGPWNATAVDCKRCATKSACCLFPSPSAPMILRATLSGIFSGVDNDYFVTILVKRVTCLLKCYDQCVGVCEKRLLNAWTQAMMLENGILPRKHACLKLSDDPVISGPATAHSAKTHSPLRLRVARSHHASSALYCVDQVFGRIQSLYYKRRSLYLCSAKAPLLPGSVSRRVYRRKGTSLDRVYVCL